MGNICRSAGRISRSRALMNRSVYFLIILILPSCQAQPTQNKDRFIYAGSENSIVSAAKIFAENPFRYDRSMAYYVTTFRDSVDQGKFIYPMGDIDPEIGVCTDVLIRSFRLAGYDLQKLLHDDASKNFSAYPYSIWSLTKPDPNIDHRRVPMLNVFFKRFGKTLTTETSDNHLSEWQAGDIVIWDLTDSGKLDHIGIIADKRLKESNRPLVIHNYPSPGYVAMEDVLNTWTIKAHYRFPK